jgi:hypothetical protein
MILGDKPLISEVVLSQVSHSLASKPMATVSPSLMSKPLARVSWLSLKTKVDGFSVWASNPAASFW